MTPPARRPAAGARTGPATAAAAPAAPPPAAVPTGSGAPAAPGAPAEGGTPALGAAPTDPAVPPRLPHPAHRPGPAHPAERAADASAGAGPGSGSGRDIARRAGADPLFRLVAYALEAAHGRPPAAVWSAPHAFHLGSPGLVAAAGWPVAAAAAPRDDGMVRLSSLGHPADSCDLPLTLSGPPPAAPAWAVRPYAVLRALARAGHGLGGTDLHVQGSLTDAAGLATAEPADCAVALAVADVHAPPGTEPDRARLARLLAAALPDGDDALRRAVLFGLPGRALLLGTGERPHRYSSFDPPASDARLVLVAVRGEPAERAAELARAVELARRAGALSAWPPGPGPGRSALVLLPASRPAAVRAAVTEDFRARERPVPRFLNIAVAGAARRED
ncbi:galactokinase [Streptomyces sp. NPDC006670]|uniref:galactokinase n=1 Tax=Streptomyces sp. NPDC006670 TaxID=3154476 RepID=UPI0033DC3E33